MDPSVPNKTEDILSSKLTDGNSHQRVGHQFNEEAIIQESDISSDEEDEFFDALTNSNQASLEQLSHDTDKLDINSFSEPASIKHSNIHGQKSGKSTDNTKLSTVQDENGGKLSFDKSDSNMEIRFKSTLIKDADKERVLIKNLDTGKMEDADNLHEDYQKAKAKWTNPLNDHIYHRTGVVPQNMLRHGSKDFGSHSSLRSSLKAADSDGNDYDIRSFDDDNSSFNNDVGFFKAKKANLANILSQERTRAKHLLKSLKKHVSSTTSLNSNNGEQKEQFYYNAKGQKFHYVKIKSKRKSKNSKLLHRLLCVQQISHENTSSAEIGASPESTNTEASNISARSIWVIKFNQDGRYLATGGQDGLVKVWATITESMNNDTNESASPKKTHRVSEKLQKIIEEAEANSYVTPLFHSKPFRVYQGHQADVLDLAWSKNNFLLTSSMDKSVRLWHVSRGECLCVFQHSDFVTSVAFHPRDDRFFLSGCLDCRLRLWNIPEKKVNFWNELPGSNLITAVGFTNDGKTAIAGSYLGICIFYETDGLKYSTQIHCRSQRGKNSRGEKITSIESMPKYSEQQDQQRSGSITSRQQSQHSSEEKLLITSNDSRLRLFNLRDKSLHCKYRGLQNSSSQIRASFSDDGKFIIAGSEDGYVYIWNSDEATASQNPNYFQSDSSSASVKSSSWKSSNSYYNKGSRKDRNNSFEYFLAIPSSENMQPSQQSPQGDADPGKLIVYDDKDDFNSIPRNPSASFQPTSSRTSDDAASRRIKQSQQQNDIVTCAIFAPDSLMKRLIELGLRNQSSQSSLNNSSACMKVIVTANSAGGLVIYEQV